MKKIHSFRVKILVIVLAFVAVKCVAFFAYSVVTTINYRNLRLSGIENLIELETEKVNKLITEMERGAVFYALGGVLSYQSETEGIIEKFVNEFLSAFPHPVGGGIWFEPYAYSEDHLRAGFYAFFDRNLKTIRLDETFFSDEYDYHNKNWYREIMEEITVPYQVVWTRPYYDASGSFSLMTTAGSPVFDEHGRVIAVSTVDWEINDVVNELSAVKPTNGSFVLLCVPQDDYIISSTGTNNSAGSTIESLPWDIKADSFELDGVKYVQFGRYMNNNWFMSIQIPEKEIIAEAEVYNRIFTIFIAVAAVLLLVIIYIIISKYINAPLKQLTNEVEQLEIGNLDTLIDVSSEDELGHLAKVLNKMKIDLKKSIEENMREHAVNQKIGAELNIATEIQANMLPCVFPPFPNIKDFDLYASMFPARQVGGDFYDFYLIDKDNLAVVIADVLGKGVPAALFMVITKTLIEDYSVCKSPKKVFETVNKKLLEKNDAQMFATAFMGFYNIPTGKFTFSCAGHNPPLLRKKNGAFEFLQTEQCFVLAWMKNAEFTESEITLESGDMLFLYTDGITEAMNRRHELFSEQKLIETLNKNKSASPKELLSAVKKEVDIFADGAEQADDITMLALEITDKEKLKNDDFREIKVEAKIENLEKVMNFVNKQLKKCNYTNEQKNQIQIAVEEIFINIASYAYTPQTGEAVISVSTKDKTTIKFEDSGKPYNPLEQTDPDLESPIETREIGGLGVFLVKKIMDTIQYTRENDKNVLVITKNP